VHFNLYAYMQEMIIQKIEPGHNVMSLRKQPIFSFSTWYHPQAVLEGCLVSWLEAIAEWRLFHIASY
jgi:hypothetical protein